MKGVIILGSSRSEGNTRKVVNILLAEMNLDFIDLNIKNIGPFDYEFKNRDDDFLPLIKSIVEEYELIIFATPVYWYSMSGTMKTFFDRISDCLKIEKETGRKLRGMKMAAISCGSDDDSPEGFFTPFELSAGYLGMEYIGHIHTWVEDDEDVVTQIKDRIHKFASLLGRG